MRRSFLIVSVCVAVIVGNTGNLYSAGVCGSCRSWNAIANDVFVEAKRVVKELGCAPVSSDALWKACIKHIDKIGKWNTLNYHLVKKWNRLVKKTSWAAIGPRQLTLGKTHKGRLVSTGGRVFITPTPIGKNKLRIRIRKIAGKARTVVTICTYFPGGDRHKVWCFESPPGKGNKGHLWNKTLTGMQGKMVSIHLDSKAAGRTFRYNVYAEAF